ncbi:DNA-packaging protein [Citrobacter pasteurii]|nr:DNA-packaging protein [Citrobacter pasteurii]
MEDRLSVSSLDIIHSNVIDNHYRSWVLSCDPACYGAATSQILAIYENFLVLVVSVLLLANTLF